MPRSRAASSAPPSEAGSQASNRSGNTIRGGHTGRMTSMTPAAEEEPLGEEDIIMVDVPSSEDEVEPVKKGGKLRSVTTTKAPASATGARTTTRTRAGSKAGNAPVEPLMGAGRTGKRRLGRTISSSTFASGSSLGLPTLAPIPPILTPTTSSPKGKGKVRTPTKPPSAPRAPQSLNSDSDELPQIARIGGPSPRKRRKIIPSPTAESSSPEVVPVMPDSVVTGGNRGASNGSQPSASSSRLTSLPASASSSKLTSLPPSGSSQRLPVKSKQKSKPVQLDSDGEEITPRNQMFYTGPVSGGGGGEGDSAGSSNRSLLSQRNGKGKTTLLDSDKNEDGWEDRYKHILGKAPTTGGSGSGGSKKPYDRPVNGLRRSTGSSQIVQIKKEKKPDIGNGNGNRRSLPGTSTASLNKPSTPGSLKRKKSLRPGRSQETAIAIRDTSSESGIEILDDAPAEMIAKKSTSNNTLPQPTTKSTLAAPTSPIVQTPIRDNSSGMANPFLSNSEQPPSAVHPMFSSVVIPPSSSPVPAPATPNATAGPSRLPFPLKALPPAKKTLAESSDEEELEDIETLQARFEATGERPKATEKKVVTPPQKAFALRASAPPPSTPDSHSNPDKPLRLTQSSSALTPTKMKKPDFVCVEILVRKTPTKTPTSLPPKKKAQQKQVKKEKEVVSPQKNRTADAPAGKIQQRGRAGKRGRAEDDGSETDTGESPSKVRSVSSKREVQVVIPVLAGSPKAKQLGVVTPKRQGRDNRGISSPLTPLPATPPSRRRDLRGKAIAGMSSPVVASDGSFVQSSDPGERVAALYADSPLRKGWKGKGKEVEKPEEVEEQEGPEEIEDVQAMPVEESAEAEEKQEEVIDPLSLFDDFDWSAPEVASPVKAAEEAPNTTGTAPVDPATQPAVEASPSAPVANDTTVDIAVVSGMVNADSTAAETPPKALPQRAEKEVLGIQEKFRKMQEKRQAEEAAEAAEKARLLAASESDEELPDADALLRVKEDSVAKPSPRRTRANPKQNDEEEFSEARDSSSPDISIRRGPGQRKTKMPTEVDDIFKELQRAHVTGTSLQATQNALRIIGGENASPTSGTPKSGDSPLTSLHGKSQQTPHSKNTVASAESESLEEEWRPSFWDMQAERQDLPDDIDINPELETKLRKNIMSLSKSASAEEAEGVLVLALTSSDPVLNDSACWVTTRWINDLTQVDKPELRAVFSQTLLDGSGIIQRNMSDLVDRTVSLAVFASCWVELLQLTLKSSYINPSDFPGLCRNLIQLAIDLTSNNWLVLNIRDCLDMMLEKMALLDWPLMDDLLSFCGTSHRLVLAVVEVVGCRTMSSRRFCQWFSYQSLVLHEKTEEAKVQLKTEIQETRVDMTSIPPPDKILAFLNSDSSPFKVCSQEDDGWDTKSLLAAAKLLATALDDVEGIVTVLEMASENADKRKAARLSWIEKTKLLMTRHEREISTPITSYGQEIKLRQDLKFVFLSIGRKLEIQSWLLITRLHKLEGGTLDEVTGEKKKKRKFGQATGMRDANGMAQMTLGFGQRE